MAGVYPPFFLESNGTRDCKNSPSLEETALNRAVIEDIQRIMVNDGEFVDAFRQNVIRVIGSYGQAGGPDEYTDKIKEKEKEIA